MKKMISVAAVLLIGAFAAYFGLPGKYEKPGGKPASAHRASFHSPERSGVPESKPDPACADCHKSAPHAANTGERAFLNQHAAFMSCGVCHAAGPLVTLLREGDGSRITAAAGGSPLARPAVSGRSHTFGNASFAARPGDCRSCHSRGAQFFANARFYDDYRRRLLEDLDVLAAMENAR